MIRVKNASMAKNKEVVFSSNNQVLRVAEALKKLGFLDTVLKEKEGLKMTLAFKNKKPVLMDVKLISKPGRRVYVTVKEIDAKKGPSIFLVSTHKGIISSLQAVKLGVGGEMIAEIL